LQLHKSVSQAIPKQQDLVFTPKHMRMGTYHPVWNCPMSEGSSVI